MSAARQDIIPDTQGFPPVFLYSRNAAAFGRFTAWLERCRQRAALAELDDRLLKDIGVSRSEVLRESRKIF